MRDCEINDPLPNAPICICGEEITGEVCDNCGYNPDLEKKIREAEYRLSVREDYKIMMGEI